MSYTLRLFLIPCFALVQSFVIDDNDFSISNRENISENVISLKDNIPENVFNGVYSECFLHLSYSCLQEKTLLYLKELNKLSEVSVLGEYVKFVKINDSEDSRDLEKNLNNTIEGPEDLSFRIDRAVDNFFNGHILKFNAFGKDVTVPNTGKCLAFAVEEFVGRKRKGGGGGGGGGGGHGGHGGDDGGKKKMMMMAMMCMKMKLMMMVPAMMGMMGMMSFKGMMFSMMSFMVSKMMLLMKILEKKGLGGGGDSGGGVSNSCDKMGWAAGGGGGGGGGGGAWMPAGGQDYGGGGGGYDANGQWQSRSIAGVIENGPIVEHDSIITYIPPLVRANHRRGDKLYSTIKKLNGNAVEIQNDNSKIKSRKKRGIVDVLQNAYLYWLNRILGHKNTKILPKYPQYKLINGVRYVYYPIKYVKKPKQLTPQNEIKPEPIVASEDFNKGEILEGPTEVAESRSMNMKKMKKLANDINDVIEQDPWE